MKKSLIILDIDQTLIDSCDYDYYKKNLTKNKNNLSCFISKENNIVIWERDGLQSFLNYLSNNFKYIGIWTNGTNFWLNFILDNIITKYLNKNRFIILFSIEKSSYKIIKNNNKIQSYAYVKDLDLIWYYFKLKNINITNKNTLLIDDNFYNCDYNKFNSIPIRKYSFIDNSGYNFDETIQLLEHIKTSNNYNKSLKKIYNFKEQFYQESIF